MLTTWMRRWSWAVAMVVAIVITVGGLIILESGRLRVAQEYETALQAQTAATELTELLANLSLVLANERGFLLTRDQGYLPPYRAAASRIETLGARIGAYYQHQHDNAAQIRFARIMATFAAQHAAIAQRLAPASGAPAAQARTLDTRAELAGMRDQQNGISALLANERARAQRAMDASRADQRISTFSVGAVSALNIVLFVLLFRNLGIQIGKQDRVQRQLLTQRQELDRLVRERTSQLEALAWHLQSVSEDEKTQLARELHDELGAILTASKMDVAWVQNKLRASEPAFADKLARALGNLDQGITLKRRIIEDMRPTVLTNFGLVTALRTLAEESAQRTNWALQLDLPEADVELDEQVAIALFRVAQEALTNAAKYAQAAHLSIALAFARGRVTLVIVDDGIGIAPLDLARSKTHGLLGMRQRVAARGGSFEIRPAQPRGTEIRVALSIAPGVTRGTTATPAAPGTTGATDQAA